MTNQNKKSNKKSNKNVLLNQRALERAHARRKQRSRRRLLLIIALFLVILIIIALIKYHGKGSANPNQASNPVEEQISQEALPEVGSLDGFKKETEYGITYYTEEFPESEHLIMGLKGSEITLVKEGDPYIESGAYCTDDRTGLISDYKILGKVDTEIPGDYVITYIFESTNAKGSIERKVRVVPEAEFKANESGIPVLMYHYVYTEEDAPDSINGNWILDKDLEEQLSYLTENNYYYPSMSELRAYVDRVISLPENSIILTFDDAQIGFYNYGEPLLRAYKIPAISFVIGKEEGVMDGVQKIKERPSRYICYESHSYDMHRPGGTEGHGGIISAMTVDEIVEDIKKGIDMCKSQDAFCYPYGDVTDDARKALRECEVKCAFTTEYNFVKIGDDPTILPRIRVLGDTGIEGFITSLG